jgi:hypothetical protein
MLKDAFGEEDVAPIPVGEDATNTNPRPRRGALKRYESTEARLHTSKTTAKVWRRPGMRAKMGKAISAGMQEVVKTAEYRQHMSDGAKRRIARQRAERVLINAV